MRNKNIEIDVKINGYDEAIEKLERMQYLLVDIKDKEDKIIYDKSRKRIEGIKGHDITDKNIVVELEKEIDYYRNKIKRLTARAESCDCDWKRNEGAL